MSEILDLLVRLLARVAEVGVVAVLAAIALMQTVGLVYVSMKLVKRLRAERRET